MAMHMIGAYTGPIVNSSGNRNRMHQFAGFIGRKPDFQMDFMNGATFATMVEPWIPHGWRKFGATRYQVFRARRGRPGGWADITAKKVDGANTTCANRIGRKSANRSVRE